jgi:t-SNARE complex subunit (syntaxin)
MIDELDEMVKGSGEVIDRIEVKISSSKSATEQASRHIESALRYQRSISSIKRILIYISVAITMTIIVIVGVIVIVNGNIGGTPKNT